MPVNPSPEDIELARQMRDRQAAPMAPVMEQFPPMPEPMAAEPMAPEPMPEPVSMAKAEPSTFEKTLSTAFQVKRQSEAAKDEEQALQIKQSIDERRRALTEQMMADINVEPKESLSYYGVGTTAKPLNEEEIRKKYESEFEKLDREEEELASRFDIEPVSMEEPVREEDYVTQAEPVTMQPQVSPMLTALSGQQQALEQYKQQGQALAIKQQAFLDEQQRIRKQQIADDQARDIKRQEELVKIENEYKQAVSELEEMSTQDQSFWASRTTGEKILAGISLALGAFGARATGGRNYAAETIERAIDRDIKLQQQQVAQKRQNVKDKSNILAKMRQRYQDEDMALAATRSASYELAQNQLNIYGSRLKNAAQIAEIDATIAELGVKKAEAQNQFMRMAMLKSGMASGDIVPQLLDEKQQARYVKGYGLARTPTVAEKLDTEIAEANNAMTGVQELLQLANKPFSSLSIEDRAKANSLRTILSGSLIKQLVGSGAVSDRERDIIDKIVVDPTAIFSLDVNNKTALKTLYKRIQNKINNSIKQKIITPMGGMGSRTQQIQEMSPEQYKKSQGGIIKANG